MLMLHYKTISAEFPEKEFPQYKPLPFDYWLSLSKCGDFKGLQTAFPEKFSLLQKPPIPREETAKAGVFCRR
jgi:hypothetical protein